MLDYNKRLTEVDEVLNYLSDEDLKKIPEYVKQIIKKNKDKEYVWNYDENKPLKEQNISRDSIAILSYINMEYLLNENQKKFLDKLHNQNEIEKRNIYFDSNKYEDLFENKKGNKKAVAILKTEKKNFWRKFLDKIKQLFKK